MIKRIEYLTEKWLQPKALTIEEIKEAYKIHNELYPKMQYHSTTCSGCRAKVYKALKKYLDNNK